MNNKIKNFAKKHERTFVKTTVTVLACTATYYWGKSKVLSEWHRIDNERRFDDFDAII